jgi:alpha-tubulin suppressor-like RCC1 family protein
MSQHRLRWLQKWLPVGSTLSLAAGAFGCGDSVGADRERENAETPGIPLIATSLWSGTCGYALDADGDLWTWDTDTAWAAGYCGIPVDGDRAWDDAETVGGLPPIIAAAGWNPSVVLSVEGEVYTWGTNEYGELGDGTMDARYEPALVPGLSDIVAVDAGADFSLALDSSGVVYAWGGNEWGELGNGPERGDGQNSADPAAIALPGPAVAISAGSDHALALAADGTVWGWGRWLRISPEAASEGGGHNETTPPTTVPGLPLAQAVSAGDDSSLVLAADGTVWAWGRNTDGQLGRGVAEDGEFDPAPVNGLPSALRHVHAGGHAAGEDGSVWVWGKTQNNGLCLGDVPGDEVWPTPTQVAEFAPARMVHTSRSGTAVLAEDGTVWTCGRTNSPTQTWIEPPRGPA